MDDYIFKYGSLNLQKSRLHREGWGFEPLIAHHYFRFKLDLRKPNEQSFQRFGLSKVSQRSLNS